MMASSSSFGMGGDNSNTSMGMNLNMHVNTGTNPVCEAAIGAGRQHYAARRYKPALEQFTRAMRACACARGTKRERCACKDFEGVAAAGESIFHEAMYNCKCDVGRTFKKCDNALHIQALDYRAATFESLGELDRARKDAEWMLELAPRLPDGYLRLGKVARLQKKHEYAWKIYNAGIQVFHTNGLANSSKIQVRLLFLQKWTPTDRQPVDQKQQLYAARQPLQNRFARRDPIYLPPEIVQWIFSTLDLAALVRCLGVCKLWRDTLTARGNERLWRVLKFAAFHGRQNPPTTASLAKLLSYSGNDAREIVIHDANRFRLSNTKFLTLLRGSKSLQRLELRQPYEYLEVPQQHVICDQLKHLVLAGFDRHKSQAADHAAYRGFPYAFLARIADNLEHLHLIDIPARWSSPDPNARLLPSMPKLRYLRLEQQQLFPSRIQIMHIAWQTPRLEQLWVHDILMTSEPLAELEWNSLWGNLKALTVSGNPGVNFQHLMAIAHLTSTSSRHQLQYLDLTFPWGDMEDVFDGSVVTQNSSLFALAQPTDEDVSREHGDAYRSLRSLRLSEVLLEPTVMQRIFQTPLQDGSLHTFDIIFPLDTLDSRIGQSSIRHLKKYDWIRGASSIRSLGLSRFRFAMYPTSDDDLPLPKFLASFPNLETVELNTEYYEDAELVTVIHAIMKETRLKKIYQSCVHGVLLDQLRDLAESRGTEIVWGERPRQWPVALEN
ncbi:hypothetical protein S7711_06298 [Stachybotrys chartarum IBT 7711]|uniref:F-box domain-containing protein n=1 Tax=Stachybotrys chartarum (strain CBS 109288 / IBT 7711) TaxID=1280523 RepID=A0A084B843_STACB|nr:hypothetical protein S7711_06298 [Stachybotrys chartarum IBT 7711]